MFLFQNFKIPVFSYNQLLQYNRQIKFILFRTIIFYFMSTFISQKCLYHMNHILIQFCKCTTCYLPVCQVCIRIHKNQHKMNQTIPEFEKLNKVVSEVENQYEVEYEKLKSIKQRIQLGPQKVIMSQKNLKRQFRNKRQSLIKTFENILINLEKQFLSSIQTQSLQYLKKIQDFEREIQYIIEDKKSKLEIIRDSQNQKKLELIIDYFVLGEQHKFQHLLQQIQTNLRYFVNYAVNYDFKLIDDINIQLENQQKALSEVIYHPIH